MKTKANYIAVVLFILLTCSCQSQPNLKSNKIVGGPCEGCEAVYESGSKSLNSVDTLPQFEILKPKIEISGTVYQKDGRTPANDVIVYIYHTNRKGLYENFNNESGWGKRHGSLRGWIKTGKTGEYTFYTFRPAAYPNGREPEHIHFTVKEPNRNEYFIDDIMFDDDPLLTQSERKQLKKRAGSGIVRPSQNNGILMVKRDIILGLNIPNYE